MIFAEPDLEDPASRVPCFKIEDSLAAFTNVTAEDVALAEVDDFSA